MGRLLKRSPRLVLVLYRSDIVNHTGRMSKKSSPLKALLLSVLLLAAGAQPVIAQVNIAQTPLFL